MAVVHFRLKAPVETCKQGSPVQLELFENEKQAQGVVAYVDVAACNQEGLFALIAQKSIRAILDIRCSKAFERPLYDHKQVCDYFRLYNIRYADLESDIEILRQSSATFFWQLDKNRARNSVGNLLSSGPCMVLFDRNEDNCEIDRFRNAVGKPAIAVVEGSGAQRLAVAGGRIP